MLRKFCIRSLCARTEQEKSGRVRARDRRHGQVDRRRAGLRRALAVAEAARAVEGEVGGPRGGRALLRVLLEPDVERLAEREGKKEHRRGPPHLLGDLPSLPASESSTDSPSLPVRSYKFGILREIRLMDLPFRTTKIHSHCLITPLVHRYTHPHLMVTRLHLSVRVDGWR